MSALGFTVIVSGLNWSKVGKWFMDVAMNSGMSYAAVEDLAIGTPPIFA